MNRPRCPTSNSLSAAEALYGMLAYDTDATQAH